VLPATRQGPAEVIFPGKVTAAGKGGESFPAFTAAEADTRFSNHRWLQG